MCLKQQSSSSSSNNNNNNYNNKNTNNKDEVVYDLIEVFELVKLNEPPDDMIRDGRMG